MLLFTINESEMPKWVTDVHSLIQFRARKPFILLSPCGD
jgi:hypothetical protein